MTRAEAWHFNFVPWLSSRAIGHTRQGLRRSERFAADECTDIFSRDRPDSTAYDACYLAAARQGQTQLISTDLADLVRPGFAVAPDAL